MQGILFLVYLFKEVTLEMFQNLIILMFLVGFFFFGVRVFLGGLFVFVFHC